IRVHPIQVVTKSIERVVTNVRVDGTVRRKMLVLGAGLSSSGLTWAHGLAIKSSAVIGVDAVVIATHREHLRNVVRVAVITTLIPCANTVGLRLFAVRTEALDQELKRRLGCRVLLGKVCHHLLSGLCPTHYFIVYLAYRIYLLGTEAFLLHGKVFLKDPLVGVHGLIQIPSGRKLSGKPSNQLSRHTFKVVYILVLLSKSSIEGVVLLSDDLHLAGPLLLASNVFPKADKLLDH